MNIYIYLPNYSQLHKPICSADTSFPLGGHSFLLLAKGFDYNFNPIGCSELKVYSVYSFNVLKPKRLSLSFLFQFISFHFTFIFLSFFLIPFLFYPPLSFFLFLSLIYLPFGNQSLYIAITVFFMNILTNGINSLLQSMRLNKHAFQ